MSRYRGLGRAAGSVCWICGWVVSLTGIPGRPGPPQNKGYEDGEGTGASLLRGEAEGAGLVQPGEEKAERGPNMYSQISAGWVSGEWGQALFSSAQ